MAIYNFGNLVDYTVMTDSKNTLLKPFILTINVKNCGTVKKERYKGLFFGGVLNLENVLLN